MNIYNIDKTIFNEKPDMTKGWLKREYIEKIISEKQAVTHTEVDDNGNEYEVIDEPYEAERTEYEPIAVYIPFTEKQLKQRRITELKQKLTLTDYKAIKYAEGLISDAEYADIKAERQAYRNEINEIEEEIAK